MIDLGGVHPAESGSVNLDTLGLTEGQKYNFDLFFAERHTTESKLTLQTSIVLEPSPMVKNIDNKISAGYAAVGAKGSPINFKKVEASWTVPTLNCPLLPAPVQSPQAAYWVGLGGVNADLEQIGTFSQCLPGGLSVHWGILEIIIDNAGDPQFNFFNPINSNDRMQASVEYLGNGQYEFTLLNITRGWTWKEVKTGSTKETAVQTAECIVEAPPKEGTVLLPSAPLSNFGNFTFEGCKADSRSLLTHPRLLKFTMKKGKTVMAEPSEINSNSDFSVTWKHE